MPTRGLVASLLVLTLLSGCASKGGSPGGDDVEKGLDNLGLDATEDTGVIRGVVVDETITPLDNVSVTITRDDEGASYNRTFVTGIDGLFGVDGLVPGLYRLLVAKTGFISAQANVDVVAKEDDPPIQKLQLLVDAANLPYYQVRQFDAYIGCSVTSPFLSAAACDLVDPVKELTNNNFLVTYEADIPPMWVQSEAIWESSQPAGDDLSLSLTDFSRGPQITVANAVGKSPIYIFINETQAKDFHYGINNSLTFRLFSTSTEGTDNVDESTFQGPYSGTVYPVLNSTPVPATAGSVLGNDPFGLTNNPFSNPECLEDAVLFDTCTDVGGAGIVAQQKVTVFTHFFYGYTPPEGWRFSEANSVPQPPL